MSKLIKLAILGGMAGAGAVAARSYAQDEPIDDMAVKVAQVGGASAAGGALLGLLLDRRSKNNAKRAAIIAEYALNMKGDVFKATKKAAKKSRKKDRIDQVRYISQAAGDAARPGWEGIVTEAGPLARDAAKSAKHFTSDLRENAYPMATHYAHKAADRAEELKPHARKAAKKAAKRAYRQAERARKVAAKKGGPAMSQARAWASDFREDAPNIPRPNGKRPVVVKLS
jgi:hypothetical protein